MKKKSNTGIDAPYRRFFEEIPEAAAILASGGVVESANKAFARLLGKPPSRIAGSRFTDFVHKNHRKKIESLLKSRRAAGSRMEILLDAAGGEFIPALLSMRLVSMKEGRRRCLVITDLRGLSVGRAGRREAQDLLRAERKRLYGVLETLPAYVVLLSPDHHVPFANKFFRDRFGDSRGRRCFEYLFDRTEPCESCESFKVLKTGKRHRWEWTGPDGRTYDIYDFPFKDSDGSPLIMEMGVDITERRRAEEELREHFATLEEVVRARTSEIEAAMEALPVAVAVTDVNGGTIRSNKLFERVWGGPCPPTRDVGDYAAYKAWWAGTKKPVLPKEWASAVAVRTGRPCLDQILEIRRFDGTRAFIQNSAAPVLGSDGEVIGSVVAILDITERRRADEQIESFARFPSENPNPVLRLSREGIVTHANDASGPLLRMWNCAIGSAAPEETRRMIAETFALRSPQSVEMECGERVYSFNVVPVSDAGYVNLYGHDITELKLAEETLRESERRWRDLANAMPQMVWTCDPAGRCDFLSRRWLEYTGMPESALLGLGWLDSIHPDERERLMAGWSKALQKGGSFDGEFRIRRRDGGYSWFKTSAIATRDSDGAVIKWYGSNTDIEDIKRAEHELGVANARLELLAAVAGLLLASDDPRGIITDLAVMTMGLLGCDVFFNYLVDEEARRLRLNTCAGIEEGEARRIEWLDYGEAICGRVARDGRRIVLEGIQRGDDLVTALVRSYGIEAYACHPLISGDRVIGTLSFGSRSRERFSDDDLGIMKAVSDHIAIAIARLNAEVALREKQRDLNRAQAVAHMGNWRMNVQRNELVWSDENHRIFGISRGAPMTYETFLASVHPDDRGYVDERWRAALRGEPYDIEHRIISNGEVRWVRERAEIEFGTGGAVLGGFGTTQDITERKRAQEEIERSRLWLERVAGTTPDIIFVRDLSSGRNVYENRSLAVLLGYRPGEFPKNADTLKTAVEPDDLAPTLEFYRDMAGAEPGEVRVLTHRILHRDGRTLWLENRVTPFSWNEKGDLVEVIGISHDITDLKRAHEVLKRDRETFERLVNERTAELVEIHHELDKARRLSDIGMLASTVAHELRNPLGVIKTAVYNIDRKKQGNALDRHLRTINKKIDESNQIINNLLMYARIKQPTYEPVRIRELLRESVESVKARNDGRSVTFRDECDEVEDVVATLDPYQIMEVMGNILTNAAQAIPTEAGGIVAVSAQASNGMLCIRVSDTGTGIDPDMLPRVFEPFFTSKSKGTGLGLSLCKELISLHNGSIDIESEPGTGTTVTVVLPLVPGARAVQA
jgi:PAS domain S-box-containing protein